MLSRSSSFHGIISTLFFYFLFFFFFLLLPAYLPPGDIGVPAVNASNNHFPCDCQIFSWMKSAMFANQSRERMMANNYCISPYEVHGKSIQAAKDEAHLLDDCPQGDQLSDSDPAEPSAADVETALETTKPSTLFSSSGGRSAHQSTAIFTVLLLSTVWVRM